MGKTETKKTLKRAITTSKTSRFFCWIEVAWPNVKPFMLNLVDHIICNNVKESEEILQNILRSTRRAVVRLDSSIAIDETRIDREYLIILYRGFLTSTMEELGKTCLLNGAEQWNPLTESLSSWTTTHRGETSICVKEKAKKPASSSEVKSLGSFLLSKRDRDILGTEVDKLFVPYPF